MGEPYLSIPPCSRPGRARGDGFQWIVPDDADTNVARSSCACDRIVATEEAAAAFTGEWGVNDEASTLRSPTSLCGRSGA
jgi:hypothetical protein